MKIKILLLSLAMSLGSMSLISQTAINLNGFFYPMPSSSVKVFVSVNGSVVDSANSVISNGEFTFTGLSVFGTDSIGFGFTDCGGVYYQTPEFPYFWSPGGTSTPQNFTVMLNHCDTGTSTVPTPPVITGPCQARFIYMSEIDTSTFSIVPFAVRVFNLSHATNGYTNGTTYTWDFGDGSPTATGFTLNHTYGTVGSYNLCVTVTDTSGCTDTYCDTITVDTLGNVRAGFTLRISMMNNGANAASIDEVRNLSGITLYPNPAITSSTLEFNSLNSGEVIVNIIDVKGSIISSKNKNIVSGKNKITMTTEGLNQGIYFIQILNERNVVMKKLQIMN